MKSDVISHHLAQALRPFGPEPAQPRGLKFMFSVHRFRQRIDFTFMLSGRVAADLEKLVFPAAPRVPSRRDELWKSTCLEVFVGRSDRASYFEMNLAPSGDWNLYAFDHYRTGMRAAHEPTAPLTRVEHVPGGETMTWHGTLAGGADLDDLLAAPGLVMNATAVLEYKSGDREYWALVHAPEKPDFHFRESFRLPL